MALQPWIRVPERSARSGAPPFNGAMALQPWIPGAERGGWHGTGFPSMEPWPFSHGYEYLSAARVLVPHPSMEPWPFSHGYLELNGEAGTARVSLQWSHGPSAMDTPIPTIALRRGIMPSMEPWPFSHGYPRQKGCGCLRGQPSMEPWPFSHGYILTLVCQDAAGNPSMEPWPFSHGYKIDRRSRTIVASPSMEPWPFSHGYCGSCWRGAWSASTFNGAMALQPWIPIRSIAVPSASVTFNGAMALQPWILPAARTAVWVPGYLQWSHGPSAMDTCRSPE